MTVETINVLMDLFSNTIFPVAMCLLMALYIREMNTSIKDTIEKNTQILECLKDFFFDVSNKKGGD